MKVNNIHGVLHSCKDDCGFTSACNRWQSVGIVEEVSHPLSGLPGIIIITVNAIVVIVINIVIIVIIFIIIISNDLKSC